MINSDVISLTIDGLPEGTKLEPEIQITFAMQNVSAFLYLELIHVINRSSNFFYTDPEIVSQLSEIIVKIVKWQ